MKVKELMTKDVHACRPEESSSRAAQIMWEQDCGIVPVVDEERRLVGVLTDRDICMAAFTKDLPPSAIRVGDIMAHDIQCCAPSDSVADAEARMRDRHVRRLPVLDSKGTLVGILSLNDVARRAAADKGRKDGIGMEEVAETLATVCQPWSELNEGNGRHEPAGASPQVMDPGVLTSRRPR